MQEFCAVCIMLLGLEAHWVDRILSMISALRVSLQIVSLLNTDEENWANVCSVSEHHLSAPAQGEFCTHSSMCDSLIEMARIQQY